MKLRDRIVAQRKLRRRSKKKFAQFVDADVLIVSHGKSGRTWLRTLISHLYSIRAASTIGGPVPACLP